MTDEQASHRRARAAIEAAHARDDAAANAEAARDARELQALADGGRPRAEPPQWKDRISSFHGHERTGCCT